MAPSINFFKSMVSLVKVPFGIILNKFCLGWLTCMLKILFIGEFTFWCTSVVHVGNIIIRHLCQ